MSEYKPYVEPTPADGSMVPSVEEVQALLKEAEGQRPTTGHNAVPIQRSRIGEAWVPIETGWLDGQCSMLHIENKEGRFTQVQPTEEQRAEAMARVVEIGTLIDMSPIGQGQVLGAEILVRPLESCRFEPTSVSSLRLRCCQGQAKVTITVFPK